MRCAQSPTSDAFGVTATQNREEIEDCDPFAVFLCYNTEYAAGTLNIQGGLA